MNTQTQTAPGDVRPAHPAPLNLHSYIAGVKINTTNSMSVRSPYDGRLVGTVALGGKQETLSAIDAGLRGSNTLSRYERFSILDKARLLLMERKEEFAQTISSESGLCMKETRYEVGRSHDVLMFAAMECLKDDGQIFSCDISPSGKQRKIFTVREPLGLAVAITPFNHPLNQW